MSNSRWNEQLYMEVYDEAVFKQGVEAWDYNRSLSENPYGVNVEPMAYALWILGWSSRKYMQ